MNQAVYLESSAWVKRYVAETGSAVLHALLEYAQAQSGQLIGSAWLGLAEVVAVLHRLANRRELGRAALARLVRQLAADRQLVRLLNLGEADWAGVVELVARHSLTAADAVHLQAALSWRAELGGNPIVFVSADRRLLRAAHREGLAEFDVERGDWAQLQELSVFALVFRDAPLLTSPVHGGGTATPSPRAGRAGVGAMLISHCIGTY